MKNLSLLLPLLIIAVSSPAVGRDNVFSPVRNNSKTTRSVPMKRMQNRTDAIYETVNRLYAKGAISADSVVDLALYHKAADPQLAERCLRLPATDGNPRAVTELGVLYAFSPEYAIRSSDGIKLLQAAAEAGYNQANGYLGLYYYTHGDYTKAKTYFDACRPMDFGFGYAALGGMYLEGKGVKQDVAKARENYRQSALKGYPRGMALYGFNLRASGGGPVNYPDSFFWLYIAGDLGDDAARTTLYLPRRNENRGDTETGKNAQLTLQWIEAAQTGKKLKNEPIYKDGFLPSLKDREKAAVQGDDWARFYLGSMNYNGDFLNQNYARAILYYEPIARDGKLPHNVLALVNERLAEMYRDGKGVKADTAKATAYAGVAAGYGSLPAYRMIENISR